MHDGRFVLLQMSGPARKSATMTIGTRSANEVFLKCSWNGSGEGREAERHQPNTAIWKCAWKAATGHAASGKAVRKWRRERRSGKMSSRLGGGRTWQSLARILAVPSFQRVSQR